MMNRVAIHMFLFITLLTKPLSAETLKLSTRTFWVGDAMHKTATNTYHPFLALRRIPWMEEIITADPILADAVVHIVEKQIPFGRVNESNYGDYVPWGPDRLAAQFVLDDYNVIGPQTATASNFVYVPSDFSSPYVVSCALRIDRPDRISLCVVYALYPPDDKIELKARLYFPPNPVDRPDYFRNVANRMREIAYCLDVTDELVDPRTDHPTLSGCQGELISSLEEAE